MKGALQTSAILLPLILSLPAEAVPKRGKASGGSSSTQGGNQVSTKYDFSKDKFGDGATLNIPTQNGIKGGNTVSRRSLEDFDLYVREALAEPKKKKSGSTTSGGNQVQTTYDFNKDQFGNNAVLNLGVQNGVQGGGTKGKRAIADLELFIRDLEEEILYRREAEAEPFLNGGDAKGGDSRTKGGNQITNNNSVKGGSYGPGTTINMSNQNQQKGGNTMGGKGGANTGNGGGGGGFSMPIQMPPLARRSPDYSEAHEGGLNQISTHHRLGPNGMSMHSTIRQKGGNAQGRDGASNSANGADGKSVTLPTLHLRRWLEMRDAEAEALMDGGGAKGGDSKSNGGNHIKNHNSVKGGKYGANSNIQMGNQNVQNGGNTRGGNGGMNTGSGGAGGSLSIPMQMPPMRRSLEYLRSRDAFAEPEPFMNGGAAKGGDSNTRGGNQIKNNNSIQGGKYGPGTTIYAGNQNSQVGGNTKGGNGGVNTGNGGGGGTFSMPIQMPPFARRSLDYLETRDADAEAEADADIDIYYELYAREAFADPDAEAEEFDLHARDAFFDDDYELDY